MAVHSLIRVESLSSACVKSSELRSILLFLYVIVEVPTQVQSWMHRTQRKMVDLELKLRLKFALLEDFDF